MLDETYQNENRVLREDYFQIQNYWKQDLILQYVLKLELGDKELSRIDEQLDRLGRQLVEEIPGLAHQADLNSPKLYHRNLYGEEIDELEFHPAYQRLQKIAIESGMFSLKWDEAGINHPRRHSLGFAPGFLYASGESGLYCPLCMTDGLMRVIRRHGGVAMQSRILPHIATLDADQLWSGAMFLTEKKGGSDVGANMLKAIPAKQNDVDGNPLFALYGEKWFCSNAGAELALILGREDEAPSGTRGLSIFLLEPENAPWRKQRIIRLKNKLGVRSMASAEILFEGSLASRIGEHGSGFAIMADMINLSRIYNSVAALAASRRAMFLAWEFLENRISFGRKAQEHALVRAKWLELSAKYQAEFFLLWRTIRSLDLADGGDEKEVQKLRLLTPLLKQSSAEFAVYAVRECMELMGGLGYIEQGHMARILRDVNVLPIWEGAGNIMFLDMLRASAKSAGLGFLFEEIAEMLTGLDSYAGTLDELKKSQKGWSQLSQDELEYRSVHFFRSFGALLKRSVLASYQKKETAAFLDYACSYLDAEQSGELAELPGTEAVAELIGLRTF